MFHCESENPFCPNINAIELFIDLHGSEKKAKLAPNHDIIMNPPGTGLGRVLMSMIIRRAKERFSDWAIKPATLGIADAKTDEERDRRNKFYRGHEFRCEFSNDPEERVGHVDAPSIDKLVERINADKVTFLSADKLFIEYVEKYNESMASKTSTESLQKILNNLRESWWKRMHLERRTWATISASLFVWALVEHFIQ